MIRNCLFMALFTLVSCNVPDFSTGNATNKTSTDQSSGGNVGVGGNTGPSGTSGSSEKDSATTGTDDSGNPLPDVVNPESWGGVNPAKGVAGDNGDAQNGPDGSVGNALRPHSDGDKPFSGERIGDPAVAAGRDLTSHEKEQLKSCLTLWSHHHPFDPNRVRPDKIMIQVELGPLNRIVDAIAGTEFSGITDTEVTQQPSLIFIPFAVNLLAPGIILPPVAYKFLNPNGWYCIGGSFDLASSLVIQLKRGAHLAESRFDLSILSDTEPVSRVGVSILSRAKVVEVP